MMSDTMFRTVSGMHSGYDPDEVDDFFEHARAVYENGPAGALSGRDVRSVAFDLVRRGYQTSAVDAALDRLEAAFVARARAEFLAEQGQPAWMARLAEEAHTLYGRLTRPDGERFAPAHARQAGYELADVDAMCQRLVAYFDRGAPLMAQDVRSATFRRRNGAAGYAEGPVDAFFDRAVEVLLGAE
jgi:DivIVA domain-containing protein